MATLSMMESGGPSSLSMKERIRRRRRRRQEMENAKNGEHHEMENASNGEHQQWGNKDLIEISSSFPSSPLEPPRSFLYRKWPRKKPKEKDPRESR